MALVETHTRDLGNNDFSYYCSLQDDCYRFAYLGTTGQKLIFSKGHTEVRMQLYCATTLEEIKEFARVNSINFDFDKWEEENI